MTNIDRKEILKSLTYDCTRAKVSPKQIAHIYLNLLNNLDIDEGLEVEFGHTSMDPYSDDYYEVIESILIEYIKNLLK